MAGIPPRSAEQSLQRTAARLAELGVGRVASICGRFYAMDRDNRWDRVQAAYDLLTLGKAEHSAANPVEGLHAAYQRGENDEFVLPTLITDDLHPAVTIRDGDTVLFMNFRPDRAREMTRALVDKDFRVSPARPIQRWEPS